MAFQVADLFEHIADAFGGQLAVVDDDGGRLSYAELDAAANRFAHALAGAGVAAGDHVGLALYNSVGHVVAILGAYKRRAVPVNVNYRYTARELDHVAREGRLRALFHDRDDDLVASVKAMTAAPALTCVLDDFLAATDDQPAARAFGPRSGDDRAVIFTGGTTGLPKGVVWRQEDLFFAALGGGNPGGPPITAPEQIADAVRANPAQRITPFLPAGHPGLGPAGCVTMALGPLVHAGGLWGSVSTLLGAGTVVLNTRRHVDMHHVLDLVARHEVVNLTLVGDTSGRPLLAALAERDDPARDTASLLLLGSGATIFSADVKLALLRAMPSELATLEAIGSSEYPSQAVSVVGRAALDDAAGATPPSSLTFAPKAETIIVDDDLRPIPPGTGRSGRLATGGRVPIGYLGDPDRTARTMVTIDGRAFVIPGDYAIADADGTIHLLGRGSLCINTGGEKVYPEEVEAVVKQHDRVADVLVVGAPDDRYGSRVVAVVAPVDPSAPPTLDAVREHARTQLAGYKLPRALVLVDAIPRSPAGKGDYAWAQEQAAAAPR
jgi:acyl-CoA synthetase (AMP-forming)/AMP-acid ligase II